jgi:hypothetical protein
MKTIAALLLASVAAAPALAQDSAALKTAVNAAALTRNTSVVSGSPVDLAPRLTLEGSTKDKVATGQIGFELGDVALTLGASAPFGGTGESTLADLDGLRNKAHADVKFLWQHWSIHDVAQELGPICQTYADALRKDVSKLACTFLSMKKDQSPDGRKALRRALEQIDPGTLFFLGSSGRLAPETFNYVTKSDFSPARERHTSWSASAHAGVMLQSGVSMMATYTREEAYDAAGQEQICRPAALAGSLQCDDEIVGGPGAARKTNQASFELRQIFGAFGVSPKVIYDAKKRAAGVQLPLYFLQDPDGGLRGGLILGWRSDTKTFTASLAVGQVLDLLTR